MYFIFLILLHLIYKKWDIFIKIKIVKKILLIYNMEMKQGLMLMIIHPKCEIKQYCFIKEYWEGVHNPSLFLRQKPISTTKSVKL